MSGKNIMSRHEHAPGIQDKITINQNSNAENNES